MHLRIATKQMEERIKRIAKEIKENPAKLIPECGGKCSKCYFRKIKDKIEKIDDEKFLKKMCKKKGFISAIALTIMLNEQKIPYVAFIKAGNENIYYAKRGKVKDELLAGLQNWDKPNVRLLAYEEIAKKNKIYLFSLPDRLICSKEMPDEFFDFISKKFGCDRGILIKWKEKIMKVCNDFNSLKKISEYFYYPPFENEIEIELENDFINCKNECKECYMKDELKIDDRKYREGEISDKEFIDISKREILSRIEDKKVFVIGDECYGDNAQAFIEKIDPKEWEKSEIERILKEEKRGIILSSPSSAKLLEKYGISTKDLKEKYERKEKEKIIKGLPEIEAKEIANFIDNIARAYKLYGKEGLLREIKARKMNVKEKAISYAFIFSLDIKSEEWKYSRMEKDFGIHLSSYAKRLIDAEGENYKKILEEFVREVG
ncbi:MAG: hypothetical protein H5T44_05290 [Thermoplasmatales archaeon]|nr:hypothetical protein [Thermoplasmatales archaeon]